MIKLWKYLKQKSKTIHELIKKFPNKSYREVEIYKDKSSGEFIIGDTSPELRDAKEKIKELQSNLDRIKKENNGLYNRIAKLTERDLQKVRESGL